VEGALAVVGEEGRRRGSVLSKRKWGNFLGSVGREKGKGIYGGVAWVGPTCW
jgi:hypothetical protein